jgi:hypothetical protein
MSADYAAAEYAMLSARWEALRARMEAGDDSALTRQRLARIDAYMAALAGSPEALLG